MRFLTEEAQRSIKDVQSKINRIQAQKRLLDRSLFILEERKKAYTIVQAWEAEAETLRIPFGMIISNLLERNPDIDSIEDRKEQIHRILQKLDEEGYDFEGKRGVQSVNLMLIMREKSKTEANQNKKENDISPL